MAVAVGGKRGMQAFVRGLFQGSPDLSILTHAIVRKKYLAHVGQENLTKEEKEELKRLVEEELLQIQVDDSPSSRELLTGLQTAVRSGGQKRRLCVSDTSGDEVQSRQEQKKQRTGKELDVSSDEQDSGIDSKKSRGAASRKATQEPWRGRRRGSSGSESEETSQGQGRDLEDGIRGGKKTTEGPTTESDVEPEPKECKSQKKRGCSKQQTGTGRLGSGGNSEMAEERRSKESQSEEEEEQLPVGKMRAKKLMDWRDNEEEKEGRASQKAEPRTVQRTRKAQEARESWDDSEEEEEERRRQKVIVNKHRRTSEELESDSDNSEDSRRRKATSQAKARKAGKEKSGRRLESKSEEREKPERQIRKGRVPRTQRKNVSRKELVGEQSDCERRRPPEKQHGRQKPKRSVSSSDASEREAGERKGLRHKKEGIQTLSSEEDESQSEEEQGSEGESQSRQAPVSSSASESGSEKSDTEERRKKSAMTKRSQDVSGSEEEKSKERARAISQKETVSGTGSEEDSEDSGSELERKKKRGGQQKKGTPKPQRRRRRNSKGASEKESAEEKGGSSQEEDSRYSKQRPRGKDREHSGKSEDHPSIQRLKRYIRECGVHRNYKKLLAGCRSRRAQVEALKKELENIGLKGTPSIAKCRALKQKREEAAEVASLDLNNIIATEGRPRRCNVWSLYSKPQESPSSPEESPIRRPATDWSRLRGVISSDGESN